ncbi:ASCH domain-containing protein [Lysinibacillus macroides]|uniref:2-oxoglutarate dehydrogenase E1 n=1 Tax=Lysinibacillus macroides TaxID=33935 RepID=A0A0N0UWG6_9BACI|nr:ASCH domain-containing protein [Lysinibacillus macroides]KOY81307.1 2-oxoglutarate dehydrogenase E1 [Lysinibacillus macroides]QPR68530.1 ASCH domain-containing protein [Lysinibacillus macroides]
MKAITIKQPWASLIALGEKRFETRSWQTKYRGPLAIHAGKAVDKDACKDYWINAILQQHGITSHEQLPTGVVLATAELIDCHKVVLNFCEDAAVLENVDGVINGLEMKFGDYSEGRYAWELDSVKPLSEPVPVKGQLSLWEWDGEALAP